MCGCVEPFTLTTDTNQEFLVIDGNFTNAGKEQFIKLSLSTSPDKPNSPVNGANVILGDDKGNTQAYQQVSDGLYSMIPNQVKGTPGNEYYLTIELPDGRKYQTIPQKMAEPARMDSIYFEVEVSDNLENTIRLFIDVDLGADESEKWLRWQVEEAWNFTEEGACNPFGAPTCYILGVQNDPSNIRLFHSDNTSFNKLRGFEIANRSLLPNREFSFQHYFSVRQFSVSEMAFDYLSRAADLAQQQGSILDPVPGPIQGNTFNVEDEEEVVLGFFQVSSTDIIRTFTTPGTLGPHEVGDVCFGTLFTNRDDWDVACCDCFAIDGASLERPEWWGRNTD
ncbi:MAG TPA: DUF4249 domain-containing protein [Cyclobacteriaceae bacterium]